MTDAERKKYRVPTGVSAYLVTVPELDGIPSEDIILLRQYDIQTDTWPCRAFSQRQWKLANGKVGWNT